MIEVKRPFDPLLFPEEKKEEEIKKNEEKEEKPVFEPSQQNSEETHGGSESTESIENSSNSSENKKEEHEEQENDRTENNNKNKESELLCCDQQEQSQENTDQDNMSKNENTQENQRSGNQEEENEEQGEPENKKEQTEQDQRSEKDGELKNGEEQEKQETGESEHDHQQSEENENEENENNKHGEETEDSNEQQKSFEYNTDQIVDVTQQKLSAKYYATEFWRFIENFAEEKMKFYDNRGTDEYNIKKMMLRQYERRSLHYYMQKKVRESIVLILDNSGSMMWWAENLQILAKLASERRDVAIYIAPNGEIQDLLVRKRLIPVSHSRIMKQMKGRKVIYVGDFDGGDTAIQLSWNNDVIWICPEYRYRHFLSHDWIHYDESKFNGVFIRAYTLGEMFRGLKRITRLNKLFIDFHENDKFEDDKDYGDDQDDHSS
jgi:hypothetical protein